VKRVSVVALAAVLVALAGLFALTARKPPSRPTTSAASPATTTPASRPTGSTAVPTSVAVTPTRPTTATTTTTVNRVTSTSTAAPTTSSAQPDVEAGDLAGEGNDNGPLIPTAPTESATTPTTTQTTPVTTTPRSTTTESLNAPQTLSLTCTGQPAPVAVTCTWKPLPADTGARLLQGENGSAASKVVPITGSAATAADLTVQPGTPYTYRLYAVRADGTIAAVSPLVTVACCGT
jgi:hypothetical protein